MFLKKIPWAWTPVLRNTWFSHTRWSPSRPALVSWCRTGSLQQGQDRQWSTESSQHREKECRPLYICKKEHNPILISRECNSIINFTASQWQEFVDVATGVWWLQMMSEVFKAQSFSFIFLFFVVWNHIWGRSAHMTSQSADNISKTKTIEITDKVSKLL